MGRMKELSILIEEFVREHVEEFDYLETLSEEDFKKNPMAIRFARNFGISVDFLSECIMHDVE